MTEDKIKKIAEWIVQEGYSKTDNGNYIVSYKEVADAFQLNEKQVYDNRSAIIECIDTNELILSETWLDGEGFDLNLCFDEGE